jgi:hypothetical protein
VTFVETNSITKNDGYMRERGRCERDKASRTTYVCSPLPRSSLQHFVSAHRRPELSLALRDGGDNAGRGITVSSRAELQTIHVYRQRDIRDSATNIRNEAFVMITFRRGPLGELTKQIES